MTPPTEPALLVWPLYVLAGAMGVVVGLAAAVMCVAAGVGL